MLTTKRQGPSVAAPGPQNTKANFGSECTSAHPSDQELINHGRLSGGTRSQWRKLACARNAADFYTALPPLADRLLRRGQTAHQIESDLAALVRHNGFGDAVAPVVNDVATQGARL